MLFGLASMYMVAKRTPRAYDLYIVSALLIACGIGSGIGSGIGGWTTRYRPSPARFSGLARARGRGHRRTSHVANVLVVIFPGIRLCSVVTSVIR